MQTSLPLLYGSQGTCPQHPPYILSQAYALQVKNNKSTWNDANLQLCFNSLSFAWSNLEVFYTKNFIYFLVRDQVIRQVLSRGFMTSIHYGRDFILFKDPWSEESLQVPYSKYVFQNSTSCSIYYEWEDLWALTFGVFHILKSLPRSHYIYFYHGIKFLWVTSILFIKRIFHSFYYLRLSLLL